ncbi:hypothetical protein RND81_05G246800 [Saponaria officinalis]|uniref:AAA+ ATPase domain-containing protein n=1 Tax=Saponaria officinalis TaxID=3572 RepID=A0AAW1L3H4_SAPOF
MSGAILDGVKVVAEPLKSFVVDRIGEYLRLVKCYDDNMTNLVKELEILSSKKLDIDAKVTEGKASLRVMTRETANWLQSLQVLIGRVEMKKLMKEDRVAEIVVKMMEQHGMKRLLKEDRETFDIVVRVVKKKCSQVVGDGEVDAEEDADYKKMAKIAQEVMKDTAEDFKKFIKEGDGAVAAVKLLNSVDLEKLRKYDDEMAKTLSEAEEISRKELEHDNHDKNLQPVDKNIIKEKVGIWRKYMGSLMAFLDDENFKTSLPDGAKLGLEVMIAMSNSAGYEHPEENAKQHRYCGCCVVRFNGYRHRHDMSETAETMAKEIKAMIDGCPPGPVTRLKRADELGTISSGFMEGLESREKLLQNILTVLRDDRVNIVGVYGMGGAGKTTLAKELANKRALNLFDKSIVVEVSEAPNIKAIQDQIAERIDPSLLKDVHSVSQRALRIYNALKSEKKILIVLDNIWKKLNLDEVGIPRERTKDLCCKLFITTREEQVCRVMGVEDANIFEAGLLNNKEALSLFENQIGEKVDSEGYKPVVERLLRKCGGLPLAIVATASALRGKDLSMWRQFAKESEKPISSQVSSEYRTTYSILETSYKLMDNEEKKMFFFLACLSPLDSAVSVDDLMRYGIGLDLFQRVNNLSEGMKQASRWANELVSSSLLLKDKVDGKVRIHDVVRASAISFFEKDKGHMMLVESIPRWMRKETFKKFAAISLLSGHDFSRLSGVEAPMLQILLLKGDRFSTTLESDFFQGMTNLKVLSLSNIDFNLGLPTSIEKLERLETFYLHNCYLKDIKLIGKLGNLLVLSLRGSTLEELPNEIRELGNLRLLDMRGCKGKINIRGNILSRLSHLEGLYMSNSFNDWASMKTKADDGEADQKARVSELNKLCHLNVLEIEVPEPELLLTLNDAQLIEQLDDFSIHVGDFRYWDLEEVRSFCRVLKLSGVDASQNEILKAFLKKTACLQVKACGSVAENFVPQLDEEGFKDLKYLEVRWCDDVKFIIRPGNQNESSAFVNLETLKLKYMRKLEMICDWKAPARAFSNLRNLDLYGLPKLTYGLRLAVVPMNLVDVYIYKCPIMKFIISESGPETEIIEFQFLKSISVHEAESLRSVLGGPEINPIDDGEQAAQPFFYENCVFPSLERLELYFNETIVTLWSKACHVSSFQNLKSMHIYGCGELQSLGSPSIFAALVRLESLSIERCDKLQQVITKETVRHEVREHVIVFPHFKYLSMEGLYTLERFYGGSYKLEFPILESLFLSNIGCLTSFVGSDDSTALFCDKSSFPCLKNLNLSNTSTIVTMWSEACHVSGFQNLKQIDIDYCAELQSLGSPSVFATLVQLEELSIRDCHKLQEVISKETEDNQVGEHIIIFRRLKLLSMKNLSNLEWFYGGSYKLEFPVLASLRLPNNYSFSDFVGSANSATDESAFPSLEDLKLSHDQTIVTLCSEACHVTRSCPFQNLTILKISHCTELQSLGSPSVFAALSKLEELSIEKCDKLQEVISKETEGHGVCEHIIVFTRLKRLSMDNLSNLQTFYGGSCKLEFPMLNSLSLSYTNSLANFVGSESSTSLFSDKIEFPYLEKLEVCCVSKEVLSLWNCSASGRQGQAIPTLLESLEISECENMKAIIMDKVVGDIEGQVHVFPHLKSIIFKSLPSITCFAYKPSAALCFPSLESVKMQSCTKLQSLCSGPFQAPKLETVALKDCNNMQSFLSKNMNNIQELPSIERVKIYKCPMLLSFLREPLAAPKLRVVYLKECPKIKWFSLGDPKNDDILELPSLEGVSIKMCSGMLSFSPRQIKAPKLSELEVDDDLYSERPNEELQHILQNLHKCTSREIEEDMKDEGNDERRKLEEQNE